MTKLSETWKDEAIAFILLALALIFFVRSIHFFVDSQADKAPRLEAYSPRPRAAERIIESSQPSYPISFATGMMVHGIMAYGSAVGQTIIYYRNQGDDENENLGFRVMRR